jgi:hypothetical protein
MIAWRMDSSKYVKDVLGLVEDSNIAASVGGTAPVRTSSVEEKK